MNCSIEDCGRTVLARGVCGTHYAWMRKHNCLPPKQPTIEICTIDGCDQPHEARGLCATHYQRWRKHGTTADPVRSSAEDRFWAKVDKRGPDECWPWLGAKDPTGHGGFWDGARHERAIRFSYLLTGEQIPSGFVIDHLCSNPPCVNPAHLEAVSPSENVRRAIALDADRKRTNGAYRNDELIPRGKAQAIVSEALLRAGAQGIRVEDLIAETGLSRDAVYYHLRNTIGAGGRVYRIHPSFL